MAVVQGIKEKVHSPIYDSFKIKPEEQWRDGEGGSSSTLRFFVDVQGKTKLETNLQTAGLLSHYNTFEARAMRVVISDLPPEFPDVKKLSVQDEELDVTDFDDNGFVMSVPEGGGVGLIGVINDLGEKVDGEDGFTPAASDVPVTADIELGLDRLVELLKQARNSDDGFASLPADEDGVTFSAGDNDADSETVADFGGLIWLSTDQLEGLLFDEDQIPEKKRPLPEQLKTSNGAGTIIGKLIYNTVTTFYVGEKIMIQMPSFFFPAGAGVYSEGASFTTHGEPTPTATFRFAEPIFIDKQQNFRVEVEVPEADTLKEIQRIYGPLNIWLVLDGYMTRDVQ
jgi:hypothetical protein